MAASRQGRGRSRQLAVLPAAVIVPPAVTLVWLGATRHLPDKVIDIGGDIWTVKVDGTDAKPLNIGLSDEYYLNIHPNGRQLIWMEENYRNELWLMKVPKTVGR